MQKQTRKPEISHDREQESLANKIQSHLRLTPGERFNQALEMMTFLRTLNPGEVNPNDWQSDRTFQIIKRS